ncbi:MAG: N-acetylglucosamine-6-phosphate deacetylase [Rhodobacterales bacterium]|nr:N-acetylglucosamine-6-phosphate deacetylase [Rhodobacterales bacterium]NCT11797.1 N-acetylglucosamine-6-phosphate deacetylase [Rhodobacterales bacterium]
MTTAPVWITADQVFDGQDLRRDVALRLEGGRVAALVPVAEAPPAGLRRVAGTLTPGFVDLQVNGGGDVLLNHLQTPAGLATMAAAHRRFGTVAILPTLITDAPDVLERAADAVIAATGMAGLLGLHVEGPHISIPRRGTHAAQLVRPLDAPTLAVLRRLRAADVPVMITLAPEAVVPGQIAQIVAMGVTVSLGHTDATAEAVRAALAEGATCFTHLFNAMSPMLNRAPGVTGAAINSTAHCGIICDGIHVADEMVGLAIRARPEADRMYLVSDAMPTVGGSDHFTLYGQDIRLVDGRLVNAEGSLAGAHVTMAQSVKRLVDVVGSDLTTALRMAVSTPARVIGAPALGQMRGRVAGDVLLLDPALRVVGDLATLTQAAAAH